MKTVFFDIDTQLDFVAPAGALYVPGAEKIMPVVARLNQLAGHQCIPVISTTDAHPENDPEFREWPPHCVADTLGQRKPETTLLSRRIVVPTNSLCPSVSDTPQIILEKQALDCFTNPHLPAILDQLNADRYVVYGVVTEYCVRCAAFGLLQTGKRVELVTDAIQCLDETASASTLSEFQQAGGHVTTSTALSPASSIRDGARANA